MKFRLLLTVLSLFLIASHCHASRAIVRVAQLPLASRTQVAHPAVARINVQERNAISQGSGSLVKVCGDHGLVITNWHVVRDSSGPISVGFPNGFTSPAKVLKLDKDWDLAALLIYNPGVAPIPVANRASQLGEPLMIAGYGSGQYRAVAGRCTQYVAPGVNMPYEMLEVSVQARQGDSGGPILNQRGELAGVLFGSGRGTTSGSYAGRVGRFLADAWPQRLEQPAASTDRANIAQAELQTPRPINTIAPEPSVTPITEQVPPPETTTSSQVDFRATPKTVEPAPAAISLAPPKKPPSLWQSLAGMTIGEQVKSVLAMIGACAIALQLLGFNSRSE